jgi:hypothetical protein
VCAIVQAIVFHGRCNVRAENWEPEVGASHAFEVETDSQTTSCARSIWCLHRRMELKYANRRDDSKEVIEGLGAVVISVREEEVTKHTR